MHLLCCSVVPGVVDVWHLISSWHIFKTLKACVIQGPVATWNPLIRGCNFSHTLNNRVNYTYGMIFDAGTLAVAFVGVLGYGNATRGSLLRAVYRQVSYSL